jgi:PhnB protein
VKRRRDLNKSIQEESIMQLNPYLTFSGQCEAAFRFYERCLGGRIEMMMRHSESPIANQAPPESRDKIMHARMVIGDRVLMGSDAPPQMYEAPRGFSVSIGVERPEEAERIFKELSEKGSVRMPIQQTFWAVRFGMLVDQFGIPWMVNCEQAA